MPQTTAGAEQLVVPERTLQRGSDGRREGDRIAFPGQHVAQVTVTIAEGTAAVRISTDGSAPTTPGPWCWRISPGPAPRSLTVPVADLEAAVVRVHADGDVRFAVQAL